MPKISEEPLTLTHFRLFTADLEMLKVLYGDGRGSSVGVNQAVRLIVRGYLRQVREQADAKINALEAAAGPVIMAENGLDFLDTLLS